jgi:hypothetical protein
MCNVVDKMKKIALIFLLVLAGAAMSCSVVDAARSQSLVMTESPFHPNDDPMTQPPPMFRLPAYADTLTEIPEPPMYPQTGDETPVIWKPWTWRISDWHFSPNVTNTTILIENKTIVTTT